MFQSPCIRKEIQKNIKKSGCSRALVLEKKYRKILKNQDVQELLYTNRKIETMSVNDFPEPLYTTRKIGRRTNEKYKKILDKDKLINLWFQRS